MRRHAIILAALLALSAAVQTYCICRAVVPAQDAVRYVRVAQAMERDGLIEVVRRSDGHPLYPALIWLTHAALRPMLGPEPHVWVTSAQVAAAVPLVLAVLPLYGFLLCVVRRRAAIAGTLFFCVLTAAARLGADALSDSLHLCLLCIALWAAGRYFAGRRSGTPNLGHGNPCWMFLAGCAIAVAALTRKEALVLPLVLCLMAALCQVRPAWRRPWLRATAGCLFLGLGLSMIWTPYLVVCGDTRPKQTVARLLGRANALKYDETKAEAAPEPAKKRSSRWRLANGQAMSFGKKEPQASLRFHGYRAASREFLRELPRAFNYGFALLAVIGGWRQRRRIRRVDLLLLVFVAVYSAAAIRFASHSGYLAPRHLLPVVVVLLGWTGEGAWVLGKWIAFRVRSSGFTVFPRLQSAIRNPQSAIPRFAVAFAALACLPQTLSPLHASREGHRQAAAWLAANGSPDDVVVDTRGWSRLYSGMSTYSFDRFRTAFKDPRLAFIVLEEDELRYDSRRSQTLRELLARGGERVARFGGRGGKAVEVYAWNSPRFAARRQGERAAN
jgi:hypothetical protein